jgi:hypothetical protein
VTLKVAGLPSPLLAGVASGFTVTALDATGRIATSYTGTVRITATDSGAVLPVNYTFVSADAGSHTFSVTFRHLGMQTLAATDADTYSITGSVTVTVTPGYAATLVLTASCSMVVTAQDVYGHTATGYTGTLHFTSTDPAAVLPSAYTFAAADSGTHTFPITLTTPGNQTVTAMDVAHSLTGSTVAMVPGRSCTQALYVSDAGACYPACIHMGQISVFAPGAIGNASPMSSIPNNPRSYLAMGIGGNGAGLLYAAYDPLVNGPNDSIAVFALDGKGNLTYKAFIAGSNIGLNVPTAIAVDAGGRIYVANLFDVSVYAAGSTGDAAPLAVIINGNAISQTTAIALDAAGRIYVDNYCDEVTVFAAGATGNAAPLATIILQPYASGIALDRAGNLYAANGIGLASIYPCASYPWPKGVPAVTVYGPGAAGNATPIATIAGSNTGLVQPLGVAVDANGWLYVADAATGIISIFAPGATGNVAPVATIAGSHTGLKQPVALTF